MERSEFGREKEKGGVGEFGGWVGRLFWVMTL